MKWHLMMALAFLYAPENDGGGGGGGGDGGGDKGAGGGDGSGAGGNPFGKPAASGGAGDGKGGDGKGAAGDGKGGDAGGAQPYFPKDFPDHLKGANDRETIDKVYGAMSGLRTEMSKRGSVPKEPKDYALALSESAARVLGGDLSKDRSAQIFRTVAHKYELTDKQAAGVFAEVMDANISSGVITFVDPVKEARLIMGDAAVGRSDEQVKEAAATRWQTLNDQVEALVNSKVVSKEGAAAAKELMETAHGVLFLETMFKRGGEHGLQGGGAGSGSGGISKADLDARINDPRCNPNSPLFNQAFADETDRLGRAFYNKDAA